MRAAGHENQLKVLDRSCLVTDSLRVFDEKCKSPLMMRYLSVQSLYSNLYLEHNDNLFVYVCDPK